MPLLLVGAPLRHGGRTVQLRHGDPSRPAARAWCRRSTCRTTGSSTSPGISSPATGTAGGEITVAGQTCALRPRPAVRRRGRARLRRACGDLRGPLGAGAAEREAALARGDGAGQPVGQQHHHRQGGDPAAAVPVAVRPLPRGLSVRRGRGRANRPPTWPGTARPRSSRTAPCWRETERFPAGDQVAVADIDLDLLRQERVRMGSFDDQPPAAGRRPGFRRIGFRLDPPDGRYGLRAAGWSASPSCRPTPPGWSRTATRPTTSRSPAWCSGCSAARHQARGDRRVRRAGFDPCADRLRPGDRPAGAAADRHPRVSPCRASAPATPRRPTPGG